MSGADCRCMVFEQISDMTRLWIKGKNFSIGGLVGDEELASGYLGGSAIIFRLAPQE